MTEQQTKDSLKELLFQELSRDQRVGKFSSLGPFIPADIKAHFEVYQSYMTDPRAYKLPVSKSLEEDHPSINEATGRLVLWVG